MVKFLKKCQILHAYTQTHTGVNIGTQQMNFFRKLMFALILKPKNAQEGLFLKLYLIISYKTSQDVCETPYRHTKL